MLKSMSAPYCPPSVQRAPSTSSCPPIDVLSALPDDLLLKVALRLPPLDRLQLQRVCRRFQRVLAEWPDVTSLEPPPPKASRLPFALTPRPPPQRLEVRLTDAHGQTDRLRTPEGHRNPAKLLKTLMGRFQLVQLTINDCALGAELTSTVAKQKTLKTLRLVELQRLLCGRKEEQTTLARPNTRRSGGGVAFGPRLAHQLGDHVQGDVRSGAGRMHQSVDSFAAADGPSTFRSSRWRTLAVRLANPCTRLAIGCTFCEETKRIDYINALRKFQRVNDLDLPPSIFLLRQLEALGFRHKNSSVLFRFIERHLPMKIRVLRVHHSASRIPNFSNASYCGVTVYYLRNFEVLQEIFGRLTPISSPHLYIRNPTSKISVFNGDIVKTMLSIGWASRTIGI
ncbi:F-box domain-containing protein [Aphelenchoides fujianensis]|nr:F-box domain-containing protein [Aphelenchoides fujianensis]